MRCCPTRNALAMMMSVGFTAPMDGKKLVDDVEVIEVVGLAGDIEDRRRGVGAKRAFPPDARSRRRSMASCR
jgi:hypothetical protein